MNGAFEVATLFQAGGPILILLVAGFIVTLVIVVERFLFFRSLTDAVALLPRFRPGNDEINLKPEKGSPRTAAVAETVLTECAVALKSGLSDELYEEVKGSSIAGQIPSLERYLVTLAGFSSVSPFVGLLGTVFGIIRAFQSLGGQSLESMTGLNRGIAEALITTAAGLLVAIPASLAYNIYRKKVDRVVLNLEIAASRLKVRYRSPEMGRESGE